MWSHPHVNIMEFNSVVAHYLRWRISIFIYLFYDIYFYYFNVKPNRAQTCLLVKFNEPWPSIKREKRLLVLIKLWAVLCLIIWGTLFSPCPLTHSYTHGDLNYRHYSSRYLLLCSTVTKMFWCSWWLEQL